MFRSLDSWWHGLSIDGPKVRLVDGPLTKSASPEPLGFPDHVSVAPREFPTPPPRLRWLPWVFLLVLAGSEVAAQTGIAPGPLTLLRSMISSTDRFLTASLLGAFVLHVWHRPPRREVVITIALALVLEAARGTVELAYGQGVGVEIGSLGLGFGLASLAVLAIGAVRRRGVDR